MSTRRFPATVESQRVEVTVGPNGLDVDGRLVGWLDLDLVHEDGHTLGLELADGSLVELALTGTTRDDLSAELRSARRAARFPSLAAATGEPLESFLSREPSGHVDVHVFAKVVVIEPRDGHPTIVPLPLIERVERDGHQFTLVCRGLDDVSVGMLGNRTDDFAVRLESARRDLRAATSAAFAQLDPALAGVFAPDGWLLSRDAAGSSWNALIGCAERSARSAEFAHLRTIAGDDGLALGVFTDGGTAPMLLAAARVGDQVVVEALDVDDRATFVFAGLPLDELSALLLLVAHRRELISLPTAELGRWAVAERTLPGVRRLRAALTGRIVHSPSWATEVSSAVARGNP